MSVKLLDEIDALCLAAVKAVGDQGLNKVEDTYPKTKVGNTWVEDRDKPAYKTLLKSGIRPDIIGETKEYVIYRSVFIEAKPKNGVKATSKASVNNL